MKGNTLGAIKESPINKDDLMIVFDNLDDIGLTEADIVEFSKDYNGNISFSKVERYVSEEELNKNEMFQVIVPYVED
jgi:hypothetical protein